MFLLAGGLANLFQLSLPRKINEHEVERITGVSPISTKDARAGRSVLLVE